MLLARLIDVSRGLGKLTWSRARYAPGEFASELFSVLLDALGATFVKLSQVIAHSPMVAPEALVRACKASLAQCTAPVVEWDAVASLLRREFRVQSLLEVFESVEASPMASASIAQVHGAVLLDGRRVVIKLVRPGVRERLAVDLDLLWLVARLGDVLLGPLISELLASSAAEMVDELRQAILAECDLRVELSNLGRFRAWLSSSLALRRAGLSGAVWAPEPILPVCTASVLTMERVDGKPLSDLRGHLASATDVTAADVTTVGKVVAGAAADGETADAPQEAGEAPSTTAWKVALAKALAVQALSIIDGSSSGRAAPAIFHADLHMGNMLFDEQSGTMAFVDFGVCGALPPHLRGALLLQALSFVLGDTAYFSEGFAYAMRTMPKAPTSAMAHHQSTATIPEATGAAEGRELRRQSPYRRLLLRWRRRPRNRCRNRRDAACELRSSRRLQLPRRQHRLSRRRLSRRRLTDRRRLNRRRLNRRRLNRRRLSRRRLSRRRLSRRRLSFHLPSRRPSRLRHLTRPRSPPTLRHSSTSLRRSTHSDRTTPPARSIPPSTPSWCVGRCCARTRRAAAEGVHAADQDDVLRRRLSLALPTRRESI